MKKIDRYKILIRYCKEIGIISSQKDLGVRLGYNNESSFSQIINGKVDEPKDFIIRLKKLIPALNADWLENETGSMLNTADATAASFAEVDKREALKADGVVMVPVINLDARGGFGDNIETDVAQFVEGVIPFSSSVARPGDVVVPMFGDSMYPRFCSGSRLLIRPVESWREFLEFGNSYVIELSDGRRLVKIVKKGSDKEHFLLVSVNPEFEPQEIPLNIISRVYIVKLMLKTEGM